MMSLTTQLSGQGHNIGLKKLIGAFALSMWMGLPLNAASQTRYECENRIHLDTSGIEFNAPLINREYERFLFEFKENRITQTKINHDKHRLEHILRKNIVDEKKINYMTSNFELGILYKMDISGDKSPDVLFYQIIEPLYGERMDMGCVAFIDSDKDGLLDTAVFFNYDKSGERTIGLGKPVGLDELYNSRIFHHWIR